jgi:hypothetical protein
VTRILANLPAGARVTVVGITDNSFAQPYQLLSAELTENEGYFKERLAQARRALVREWQQRSNGLEPRFLHTDILGTLFVAAELFVQVPNGPKILFILSDMRHEATGVNLEAPRVVPIDSALAKVDKARLIANLQGVEIYVLGVDAARRHVAYWQSLRDFWVAYFQKAGGNVKAYMLLRDLPRFAQ